MSIQTEIILDVNQYIKPLQATVKATADATAFIIRSFNSVKQSMDLKAPRVDVSSIQKSAKEIELQLERAGREAAQSFKQSGENAGENFNKGITPELKKTEQKFDGLKKGMSGIFSGLAMGGGIAIAQQGIQLLTQGVTELWNQALKADEISTAMEIGFRNAGLTGAELTKQIERSENAARELGFSIGVAPGRLKELSALAGTLGGATGKMNDQFVKAAIGIEKATGGLTSGEAAIKLFSKGIADPENVEALSRLKSQFPKLAAELAKITDPTLKAQRAIELLGGTYTSLENDLSDVGAQMDLFKMQAIEGAQSFGGAFLSSFDIKSILAMFGKLDIKEVFEKLKTAGEDLGKFVTNVAKVVVNGVQGWWAYFDNAFVKPFGSIWDLLLDTVQPFKELFTELFGKGSKEGIKLIDVMGGIGKVVGFIIDVALVPLRMAINGIINVVKFFTAGIRLIKENFEQAYNSSALFKNIINGVASAFKSVIGFIGTAIDYVAKFYSSIGKKPKTDGVKEIKKETDKATESVVTLNKDLNKDTPSPKTEKTKKTFTDLADYIQGLKDKISSIEFDFKLSEQTDVISKLEKQIKDVANNSKLTNVAKIEITAEIETQKAILETERELTKLATANQKNIEGIEKDFEAKKKGASKSDIIKAETEKNNLIKAENQKYYKEKKDITDKNENVINGILKNKSKLRKELIVSESDVLRDLQIENISNEKERAYQKELESLKRKFQDEVVKYKDNNAIKLELFKKYQSDLEKLQAGLTLDPTSEISGIKTFLEAFNSQLKTTNEAATKGNEDELNKRKENLENSIQDMSFSYSSYVDQMKQLDQDRLNSMRESSLSTIDLIANQTKALVNSLTESITAYENYATNQIKLDADIVAKKAELRKAELEGAVNAADIKIEVDELQNKSELEKLAIFGDIVGKTKGIFEEQTAAYKAMAIIEATIATYVAATKVLSTIPFPFNFVAAGLITAAGLANIAKIIGAESGVIGINNSYNKAPGRTDKIPIMVAKGESIVSKKGTDKYRSILEQINSGTYNYQRIDGNAGKVTGVIRDFSGTSKEMQYQSEIISLKSEISNLNRAINNMQSSKNSRLDLELTNTSLLKNKHIVLASNKYKRKELSRL